MDYFGHSQATVVFYYKENCNFRAMETGLKILKAKNTLCSSSPSLCWKTWMCSAIGAALSHHLVPWAPAPSFTNMSSCRSSWHVGEAPSAPGIHMCSGGLGAAGASPHRAHGEGKHSWAARLEGSVLPAEQDSRQPQAALPATLTAKVCLAKEHDFLWCTCASGLSKALQHLSQTVELQRCSLSARILTARAAPPISCCRGAPCPYPLCPTKFVSFVYQELLQQGMIAL